MRIDGSNHYTLRFGKGQMPACHGQVSEEDLKFVRGFPTKETAKKLHDELDYQRAVQVYLRHIPAMSMYGFRRGIDEDLSGKTAQPQKVALWENLLDVKTLLLTGNIYRLYGALEPYFNQSWKLNDLVKEK